MDEVPASTLAQQGMAVVFAGLSAPRRSSSEALKKGADSSPITPRKENRMNSIVYLVGLIVIIIAILSFFGLR